MTVIFDQVPVNSGRWLLAEADGKPQLGAYMPASGEPNLTVYWRGRVAEDVLGHIVRDAEAVLAKTGGDVQGTLIAYGKLRKSVGPTHDGLSHYLAQPSHLCGFDAYRAELEGHAGKVIIWANVKDTSSIELKEGGENIGLCVTPALFDGPVRAVIETAIHKTMGLATKTTSGLLEEISKAMLHNGLASY
jgi:hypothetical protein